MSEASRTLDVFFSCRQALVKYAASIVGDRARAEDVVQEAYLRLHPLSSQELDDIRQPVAYVYRVVRNLSLDASRSELRSQQRHATPPEWLAPVMAVEPEEACERDNALAHLAFALDGLPEANRRALEMHRLEGLTLAQIAERLGVSLATAHRLVRDAMVRLARALPDEQATRV
jgi:RNA polymerase sigma factor (sigma-70 family)